jgi:hypothetical protein
MAQTKGKQGYVLESVIINSSRMLEPVDIAGVVSDMEIFEHIDLPYITGQIAFIDTLRLYDRIDIQGAEFCTVTFRNSEAEGAFVEHRFVIDKIITNKKANEQTDLVMLHLVEDILFLSNLKNVNKCYQGSPDEIITKIAQEWLDYEVEEIYSDVFQKKMKVIVPNLTPVDAMTWIKNRGTTTEGFPTYLFSSFTQNKLVYADLKTMIEAEPINKTSPFIHGPTDHDLEKSSFRLVPIKEYSIENAEDMYGLIADGLISAEHHFIDTHNFTDYACNHNIIDDVIENMIESKIRNQEPVMASNFTFNDVELQNQKSRTITQISSAGAYDDGTNRYVSYDEDENTGHKKKVASRSLKKLLRKSPITIRLDGMGFINSEGHYTTGNVIRILFSANRPMDLGDLKLDLKKSGDYLIYGAKHSFAGNRYQIHLNCVKLTNYTDDNPLKVIG